MKKHIKKLSIMTGFFFTGMSFVGCQNTKSVPIVEDDSQVIEEVLENACEIELEGEYGLGDVSQEAFRFGEDYVGFLVHADAANSYSDSFSIHYMPLSSFSVLTASDCFYIVKDYEEGRKYNTYYDYLRDRAVPDDLVLNEVIPLSAYMESHSTLFSNAVSDKYLHFTIFDSQKILQEVDSTIFDLATYEQKKYLGVSRVSSTEDNVCYINYVPVEDASVVYNSNYCYLVDQYQEGISPSIYQVDLLRGDRVPNLSEYQVLPFSDFVSQHADDYSSLVDFLNNGDALVDTISGDGFIDSYQSSIAMQKVK